jgi:alcohol dehydrogenase YqhD (iron-dependent ADH family)
MNGDFVFCNPTKVYFGKHGMDALAGELQRYGQEVLLVYGGGSIKKYGLYDQIIQVLKEMGKHVTEISGVMPNPTIEKLMEGVEIARAHRPDLILAAGGGSVIDYSKGLSASIDCPGDPWETFYLHQQDPTWDVVPVGAVLTMVGTGSEMNAGSVITNHEQKLKIGHVFPAEILAPRFAIMNPEVTMTLPHYQMISGIYDMFNHICEQYFSGTDDNTSDYMSEGLMRSVISSSRVANTDPSNYEARSNLMWTASWALNGLIGCGKTQDWMVHMLGQSVGAETNAAHGHTLAAVSLPYYRMIMPYGLPKFVRFAETVWNVSPEGKTQEEIAEEGLKAMENWMKELGLSMNISVLGATEDMIPDLVRGTLILTGGYHTLSKEEIADVFRQSL